MLAQPERAFNFRRLAADGGFVGLEESAKSIKGQVHRLISVEKEVHSGDNMGDRRGPDGWFAARAIRRFRRQIRFQSSMAKPVSSASRWSWPNWLIKTATSSKRARRSGGIRSFVVSRAFRAVFVNCASRELLCGNISFRRWDWNYRPFRRDLVIPS